MKLLTEHVDGIGIDAGRLTVVRWAWRNDNEPRSLKY
jgi:hypothetical protein